MRIRAVAWLVERVLEILFGAALVLWAYGPGENAPTLAGQLRLSVVAILFFYTVSAYLPLTMALRIWRRTRAPILETFLAAVLFVVCALVFHFQAADGLARLPVMICGGAASVIICTLVGEAMKRRLEERAWPKPKPSQLK